MKIRQLILEAKKDLTIDQLMALEEAVMNAQRSGSLATRVMRQALPIPVTLVSTGFVLVCVCFRISEGPFFLLVLMQPRIHADPFD